MIQLIVGLGNPGPSYAQTRHNAGAWLLERVAQQAGASLRVNNKFHGCFAKASLSGSLLYLLLPTTYMNKCGQSVRALASFYKIDVEDILVAHDDLDLACGDVRIKKSGGHGGHNGLRDLIAHLGSPDFARVRIGIGHPGDKSQVIDYVLHPPSLFERQQIDEGIDRALTKLPDIIDGSLRHTVKL